MVCKLCSTRQKNWVGDDPICAFIGGEFNSNNWNCATMNALRYIAEEKGLILRNDLTNASLSIVPLDGEKNKGYIVMSFYKSRGKTGNAVVMFDDKNEMDLTEDMAISAIEFWERR